MKNIEYNFCRNAVSIRTDSRRAGRQKYLDRGPFVLKESEDTPVGPTSVFHNYSPKWR